MKNHILKYGLLSGLALGVALLCLVPFMNCSTGSAGIWSMLLTYTIMILCFLIVFVGVKHYRDHDLGGFIGFGRALGVGLLMGLVTCLCYTAVWEVLLLTVEKNFAHNYAAAMIQGAEKAGKTGAALDKVVADAHAFEASYANPLYSAATTMLEPLPVLIVMPLVTAGILRRKPGPNTPTATALAG